MKPGRIISVKTSTERSSGGEPSYYVTINVETAFKQYEDLRLEVDSLGEQAKTFEYWRALCGLSQNMQEKA